ncbi:MAG: YIP1 family protein [Marinibacterium sp.]|nr:YIP1 family protein [Marinibacterium sp.]
MTGSGNGAGTGSGWQAMIVTSVTDPAQVARRLIDMRLGRDVLWTGLALAAVLNTLLISLSNMLVADPEGMVPLLFQAPTFLIIAIFVALVLLVGAFTLCGHWMGGQGRFEEVMVLVLWLQLLRVLVQSATLLLVLLAPVLSLLVAFVAGILGIYITLHFLKEAHRLQSLGKAAGVLIASLVGMVLALMFLISLIGGPLLEAAAGV